jgi:hypothetical protein
LVAAAVVELDTPMLLVPLMDVVVVLVDNLVVDTTLLMVVFTVEAHLRVVVVLVDQLVVNLLVVLVISMKVVTLETLAVAVAAAVTTVVVALEDIMELVAVDLDIFTHLLPTVLSSRDLQAVDTKSATTLHIHNQ